MSAILGAPSISQKRTFPKWATFGNRESDELLLKAKRSK